MENKSRDDGAHAGQSFNLTSVTEFCRRHDLWLVEDNCDALGSLYARPGGAAKFTGTFGDYPRNPFIRHTTSPSARAGGEHRARYEIQGAGGKFP